VRLSQNALSVANSFGDFNDLKANFALSSNRFMLVLAIAGAPH
jgi:hypothetical protein